MRTAVRGDVLHRDILLPTEDPLVAERQAYGWAGAGGAAGAAGGTDVDSMGAGWRR